MNIHNMIAGNRLAGRCIGQVMPLPANRHDRRIAWPEVGSLARIIAILRAWIEARAPLGYEDETGFHYGTEATHWSFTI